MNKSRSNEIEKEFISLSVSNEQLELIENSVKERLLLWKRTLEYHSGNKGVDGVIEGCRDESEAEYIVGVYDELYRELVSKGKEVEKNQVEYLGGEELEDGNKSIGTFALSRGDWEQVVYVYQCRKVEEMDFLFFQSVWELIQFFHTGGEAMHRFSSDEALHAFMRSWRGE